MPERTDCPTDAVCRCGSEWFVLCDQPDSPAAVALENDGTVRAWAGKPVCVECAEPWDPDAEIRPFLSIVPND